MQFITKPHEYSAHMLETWICPDHLLPDHRTISHSGDIPDDPVAAHFQSMIPTRYPVANIPTH
jgi:hypothetical protein